MESFDRAIKLDPKNPEAYCEKGNAVRYLTFMSWDKR